MTTKKDLQSSKFINNWWAFFLVSVIFTIDCLLGNVYKIVSSEDYVTQVYQYVSFKEMFGLIPYLLLTVISLNIRLRFDRFDMALLFTCLILQIFNCFDFFVNNNWRPVWADWVIFFSVYFPCIGFKLYIYRR